VALSQRRDGRSQYAQPRAQVAFKTRPEASALVVRDAWPFASAVDNEPVEHGERYFDASRQVNIDPAALGRIGKAQA
jgi:hypothetical protein